MKRVAREKLAEKDIEWQQVYTDKTLFLKEQFEAVVGPGSYFRFEGEDLGSGDSYYCIIGPAKVHKPRQSFLLALGNCLLLILLEESISTAWIARPNMREKLGEYRHQRILNLTLLQNSTVSVRR